MEHAWDLRQEVRKHEPDLILGGWANPHASVAQQVDFLHDERFCAEFYLTQVVSHLNLEPVKRFLAEIDRRPVPIPGMTEPARAPAPAPITAPVAPLATT